MKRTETEYGVLIELTESEYTSLLSKIPKHTLGGVPVELCIPMPVVDMMNWEQWKGHATGVLYEGVAIRYEELKHIRTLMVNPSRLIGTKFKVTVWLEGRVPNATVLELDHIISTIDNLWPTVTRKTHIRL